MISARFNTIKISGIVTSVPKNKEVLRDKYVSVFGEEMVEGFIKTTGVVERRIATTEQTASDFAYVAARYLLEQKKIDRESIGVCVFVTQTPDYKIPATACVLHKRLGLSKDCMAFDVNLGCSGYVYGLQIVASLLETMNYRYGLLLVGDTSNKKSLFDAGISPTDSSSVMLFGEGGAATLLEKGEGDSEIRTAFRTDGDGFKAIIVPAGAARKPVASFERVLWADGNKRSDYDLFMNGVDVFSFSISEVPRMINDYFEESREEKDSFDCYAFHQANCYIFKQIVKRARIPKEKVHISMDRYGNTSVTSIPLTICDRYGGESERKDCRIFACGFGVGLSWGICTFSVNQSDVFPIIETDEFYTEGEVSHD